MEKINSDTKKKEDYDITKLSPEYRSIAKKSIQYIQLENLYKEITNIDFFINDNVFRRLLTARQNDEDKAFEMWKTWLRWRLEFKPESIKVKDIYDSLKIGKAFLHGVDKEGRPCMIIRSGLHVPSETTLDETMRVAAFWLERAERLSDKSNTKQLIAIVDRSGVGWKNIDYGALGKRGLIQMMQDFYAERLYKVCILHVNYIFRMIFKLISPLMSERTKGKMKILDSVDDLKTYFDSDQLLEEHGGTSKYVYKVPNDDEI